MLGNFGEVWVVFVPHETKNENSLRNRYCDSINSVQAGGAVKAGGFARSTLKEFKGYTHKEHRGKHLKISRTWPEPHTDNTAIYSLFTLIS